MIRTALYPRVSSHEQAQEGYSIGEQIERMTKYCEAMGWEVAKVYTDAGYSGASMDRPGLKLMIKDIEAGRIDKVLVYKLDRLSRSQKDTLHLIEDVFLKNNTEFVSMNENFDTSTPFGRAMIGILAVFAQLEREQIKERMTMGKEARAKEGKWNGGSTTPIGYDYDIANDLLVINEYEAMQVREVFKLFVEGKPLRTIETYMIEKGYKRKNRNWDCKSLRRVLGSKVYIGYMPYHGNAYPAEHEPIINEETFYAAQAILELRAEQYTQQTKYESKQTTYLGGLIFCKNCGARYSKQNNARKHLPKSWWYMCNSRNKKVKKMIKDPTCRNKNWKMNDLDNKVFNEIKKLKTEQGYLEKKIKEGSRPEDSDQKISVLENQIQNIDDQISRFMDLYGIGKFTIEQVTSKIDPLNESRNKLQHELDELNTKAGRVSMETALHVIDNFEETLTKGDFNEIRLAVETLVRKIEIDEEDVYIYWNFI